MKAIPATYRVTTPPQPRKPHPQVPRDKWLKRYYHQPPLGVFGARHPRVAAIAVFYVCADATASRNESQGRIPALSVAAAPIIP